MIKAFLSHTSVDKDLVLTLLHESRTENCPLKLEPDQL